MTTLEFTGEVNAYDYDRTYAYVSVGGVDVLDKIEKTFSDEERKNIKFLIAHGGDQTLYEGKVETFNGFTGTEVTPAELPEIIVGDKDVTTQLRELDGKLVHVRIDG